MNWLFIRRYIWPLDYQSSLVRSEDLRVFVHFPLCTVHKTCPRVQGIMSDYSHDNNNNNHSYCHYTFPVRRLGVHLGHLR
jgi:hypothetical protein